MVAVEDVERVDSLFMEIGEAAEHLREHMRETHVPLASEDVSLASSAFLFRLHSRLAREAASLRELRPPSAFALVLCVSTPIFLRSLLTPLKITNLREVLRSKFDTPLPSISPF